MLKPSHVKKDGLKEGWDDPDARPSLCESCLGDNPYIRMLKDTHGKACNACGRPYTRYRWKAGREGRFKNTVICKICSQLKHCCQSCLMDLTYGLPLKLRDRIIAKHSGPGQSQALSVPKSEGALNYFGQLAAQEVAMGGGAAAHIPPAAHEELLQLKRDRPAYHRNKPKTCSFWLKGNCTRGDTCPYLHEFPKDWFTNREYYNKGIEQSIKDRFFGIEDHSADRMLERMQADEKSLAAPSDKGITTLCIIGFDKSKLSEQMLREKFAPYGSIQSIRVSGKSDTAFIEFSTRAAAQEAVTKTRGRAVMSGVRMRVKWANRGGDDGPKLLGDDRPRGAAPASSPAGAGASDAVLVWDFDWSFINENIDFWLFPALRPAMREYMTEEWSRRKTVQAKPCFTSFIDHCLGRLHEDGVLLDDIEAAIPRVPKWPKHLELVNEAWEQHRIPSIVISDANTFFIRRFLRAHGVTEAQVPMIISNPATPCGQGRLRVRPNHSPAHTPHGCDHCPTNLCKGARLEAALRLLAPRGRSRPRRVAYVGDGSGDLCPALRLGENDLVAARTGRWLAGKLGGKAPEVPIAASVVLWEDDAESTGAIRRWITA